MAKKANDIEKVMELIAGWKLPELQKFLKSKKPDVNEAFDDRLAIVDAAGVGVEYVEALLAAGADVNAADPLNNNTALIIAAKEGNVPLIKVLLTAGADVNRMPGVTSPLMAAAMNRSPKHLDALKELIAAGANVNQFSHSLSGAPCGFALRDAARVGNVEGIKILLAAGANINARVCFGTALIEAAEENHVETVKALLAAGADRTLKVENDKKRFPYIAGMTALEVAQKKRLKKIIPLLEAPVESDKPVEGAPTVGEAWRRLETAIQNKRPALLRTFKKGATAKDITALESIIGRKLNAEAVEFFQHHNGQSGGAKAEFIGADSDFHLLPIVDVIAEWTVWNDLVKGGEFRGKKSMPDPGVSNDWYHPGWIPISADGLGNSHCLDLSPAKGGQNGQVVLMWHDQAARPVVAKSLADWLDQLAGEFEER